MFENNLYLRKTKSKLVNKCETGCWKLACFTHLFFTAAFTYDDFLGNMKLETEDGKLSLTLGIL